MAVDNGAQSESQEKTYRKIDLTYILWILTLGLSGLATLTLLLNIAAYLFGGIANVSGSGGLFSEDAHKRWLMISAVLGGLAVAAHFIRLRAQAIANSVIAVEPLRKLSARSLGGDEVLEKFESTAIVQIEVYNETLAAKLSRNNPEFQNALTNGLAIAISDPVTRFSKSRIEETLKLSLGEVVGLDGLAAVRVLDLKQNRIFNTPKKAPAKKAASKEELLEQAGIAQSEGKPEGAGDGQAAPDQTSTQ